MLEIRHSGIWQLSSSVLSQDGAVLVIDPGYFPRELDELVSLAASRGEVRAVAFTHGHWDHVLGWRSFPGAPVLTSAHLAAAIRDGTTEAERNLRDARDFDGRWYVDRGAPLAWPPPEQLRPLAEGDPLRIGSLELTALSLPGHSPDGLGLFVASAGLLFVGDYLSPCEIPFVADLAAYRATLRRLLGLLDGTERVIPGHGPPLSAAEARAIAAADLRYLDALAACAESGDLRGAQALPLPRAAEVPGMPEHHLDNLRAAGLKPA
jgi:hydroxyacylglutathione hydrolase